MNLTQLSKVRVHWWTSNYFERIKRRHAAICDGTATDTDISRLNHDVPDRPMQIEKSIQHDASRAGPMKPRMLKDARGIENNTRNTGTTVTNGITNNDKKPFGGDPLESASSAESSLTMKVLSPMTKQVLKLLPKITADLIIRQKQSAPGSTCVRNL